jgi:hypothetical protein
MIKTLFCLVALVKVGFKQRHELALENLALRQQLAVFIVPRNAFSCEEQTGCSGSGSPECGKAGVNS